MMITYLRTLIRNKEGNAAMEYGLLAALIAVVIIGAVTAVGLALEGKFFEVSGALGGAAE